MEKAEHIEGGEGGTAGGAYTKPLPKKPVAKARRVKAGNDVAPNIAALCQAVGFSKPTYENWKDHPEAPPKLFNGYSISKWKAFAESKGIQTAFVRQSQQDLKNKLTECDIELRKIEIQKRKGELVDKQEATAALLELASMFRLHAESIPSAFDTFRNAEITKAAEKLKVDILNGIRSKLKGKDENPANP